MRFILPAALLLLVAVIACSEARTAQGRSAAALLLAQSSIQQIHDGLRAGKFSCVDLITEQFRRIDAYNSKLKAFIPGGDNRVEALEIAKLKDKTGVNGKLHCIPVAIKDNIDVRGLPTTSGAPALQTMVAAKDSHIVARIKSSGGIIIGKANMAEMSDSGVKSESTLGGVCSNPWDPRRSCYGSSGGSGAAVAAGLAVIAIGTDTEGSVIGPCTASGLLCLRPTQGGVYETIKEGVYPAFSRQDLLGIMAKSKEDYLTAHDAIYGTNFADKVGRTTTLKGLKIRFLDNFYETIPLPVGNYVPEPEIIRLHNQAAQRFANLGAKVERYKTSLQELGAKFSVIFKATTTKPTCSNSCMKSSLDAYLSRHASTGPFRQASDLLSVIHGFPASYQEKLKFTLSQRASNVCGTAACAAYDAARTTIARILTELQGDNDVLAVPFTAKLPQLHTEEPSIAEQITPALNPYTGWPSLSLPVGFSAPSGFAQPQGMPVTVVLLSKAWNEGTLLWIASAYLNTYAERKVPALTPPLKG